MNVVVFGASGNVGRLVTARLLEKGYTVTAFVHGRTPFSETKNLRVVRGDVHSPNDIAAALAGAEAIISTLGSWGTPQKDILGAWAKNIVPLAQQHGVQRVISLTGSAASLPDEKLRFIDRLNRKVLGLFAPKILNDGEHHLELLHSSNLDWIVIRSPVMRSSSAKSYRLRPVAPSPFATISRRAVAEALVDQLDHSDVKNRAPHIYAR